MKFVLDSTERTNEPPSPTQRREKSGRFDSVQTSLRRQLRDGEIWEIPLGFDRAYKRAYSETGEIWEIRLGFDRAYRAFRRQFRDGRNLGEIRLAKSLRQLRDGRNLGDFRECTGRNLRRQLGDGRNRGDAGGGGWSLGVVDPPAPPFAASMTSPPPLT